MSDRKLRLGLPKGSLQEATLMLLAKAGFNFNLVGRSYYLNCDDPEIEARLVRSQEMGPYVQSGHFDAGITGLDWIMETNAKVQRVEDLVYSKATMRKCRWVLAVPESSPIHGPKDLDGMRVATELVNVTRRYFRRHGVRAKVEFSWGATEIKAPEFADAIVEITETGKSLQANNLRVLDTILETWTQLIANREAWADEWKREKIQNLALLLKAAISAEGRAGLKLNVRVVDLEKIIRILPAITSPTVSHLKDERWVAVETIIEEKKVRQVLPALKAAGAEGIVEYPLNKVIE
ncbi:MAG: ATP phosphoribosyltransferase [candidate division BRC1 bacterium ADurb.BinA364]|nr:MAG: ATP phosphoribosyltransferase [candidate division BRC1 bacterium ADurb.BinA364]